MAMLSIWILRMYTSVKQLHIELTDKCNAACPMCIRTNPKTGKEQPWLLKRELTLEDFQDIVRPEDLLSLEKINFCGNYGEPLAAKDLIPIIKYVYSNNPEVNIEIASNASTRSEDWWWELLEATHKKPFKIIFGIDGTNQSQNEFYRRNTNFEKIVNNAKFFIENGGHAEWQYLVFKHNEKDIEKAKQMSIDMGFKNFYTVATERFWSGDYSEYVYKDEKYRLERSTITPNYKTYDSDKKIKCFAKAWQEAYIDCLGFVTPCCYLGLYLYAVIADRPIDFHNQNELMTIFSEMDLQRLQGRGKGLAQVVKDPFFFDLLLMHEAKKPERCYKVCGAEINKKEYVGESI